VGMDHGAMRMLIYRSNRKYIAVDYLGVEFQYHGDTVIWLWPWKRSGVGRVWLSISFEATFPTLRSIDTMWNEFQEACNRV
jgi:hypothetical protein